jgi:hypothetical protein
MSDNGNFGFGKFVPGFDFLQNLAKGASPSVPQLSNLSNWVAPTLNVEDLEKRISELKAVHFWLDQNSKALGATIQALEVQKMTLATLKGMNFSMGELANALKVKTADAMAGGTPKKAETAADAAGPREAGSGKGEGGAAPVDPLQWWGALTQQFQEIAANAMKDVAQKSAVDAARTMATGAAREAMKAATGMAKAATGMGGAATGNGKSAAPAKARARKTPARKAPAKSKAKTA